jgi:hypothetical protein
MRFFLSGLIAIAMAAALPGTALATVWSYTLNVPLTASNIPAGTPFIVECYLYPGANRAGAFLNSTTSPTLTATNGSWSGTTTVKISSTSKPGSYSCAIVVFGPPGQNALNQVNGSPDTSTGYSGTMSITANLP